VPKWNALPTTNATPTNGTNTTKGHTQPPLFDATVPDYFCFHAPYNKLVQKSYARLFLLDARRRQRRRAGRADSEEKKEGEDDETDVMGRSPVTMEAEPLAAWLDTPIADTYADKTLEKTLKAVSAPHYKARLADANAASVAVGNTYTASVFLGLASLVDRAGLKPGQSIVLFSYGSGALATMYQLQV
jgi:hydroxymethylglutaryl-CoA synthase